MKDSFQELNLDAHLISSLSKLGITKPSPIQYHFIKSSLDETSIIFQSKSGTGKTVAFSIIAITNILKRKNVENEKSDVDLPEIAQITKKLDELFGDVVIIVPTRELTYQIYLFFLSLCATLKDIKPFLLIGGSNLNKLIVQMREKKVNIVISTPGRFKTILKRKFKPDEEAENGAMETHKLFKTHTLILDEADMLLDDHFFDQTKYILSKMVTPFVQLMAVSATFTKPQLQVFEDMVEKVDAEFLEKFVKEGEDMDVSKWEGSLLVHLLPRLKDGSITNIEDAFFHLLEYERKTNKIIFSPSYLNRMLNDKKEGSDEEEYVIKAETTVPEDELDGASTTLVLDNVDFYLAKVPEAPNIVIQIGAKIDVLVKILTNVKYKRCIVFCNQSHTRIQTYKLLQALGFTCYINSSRVSQTERIRMLYDITSIEKVVILSTDVMSRGIGFSNVDLVVNMDIPSTKEVFLHRSGRSGRFGAKGICVSICMEYEVHSYNYFIFTLNFVSQPVDVLIKAAEEERKKEDRYGYYREDEEPKEVAKILGKSVDFARLFEVYRYFSPRDKKNTLAGAALDTDRNFKISILGIVTEKTVKKYERIEVGFMYVQQIGKALSVVVRDYNYRWSRDDYVFDGFGPKLILYAKQYIIKYKQGDQLRVTQVLMELGKHKVWLTMTKRELHKLVKVGGEFVELNPIDCLIETRLNGNMDDLSPALEKLKLEDKVKDKVGNQYLKMVQVSEEVKSKIKEYVDWCKNLDVWDHKDNRVQHTLRGWLFDNHIEVWERSRK